MAQTESMISEEMRAEIGVEGAPRSFVIEAGHIRHFATAIDDANPIYADEAYARNTPYGGVIAPPTFFRATGYALPGPGSRRAAAPQGPPARQAGGPPMLTRRTEPVSPTQLGELVAKGWGTSLTQYRREQA